MKNVNQKTRGFNPSIAQAETVEEFDTLAGASGAALAFANAEATYRSILPKAWGKVFSGAEAQFGVAREVVGTKKNAKDEDVNVMESDKDFSARLKATVEHDDLAAFLQTCCDEVGFDVSKTGRTKKPAEIYYAQADQLIANVASEDTDWDTVMAGCAQVGVTTELALLEDGSVDRDVLATILKDVHAAMVLPGMG